MSPYNRDRSDGEGRTNATMRALVADWYVLLSTLNAAVAEPLRALSDGLGIPVLSALLFGLIGATSPCQLTTNAGALAYVARQAGGPGDRLAVARHAVAFVAAKALVYTGLGAVVLLAGRELSLVPAVVVVRKALGPLMIVLGLYLLGLLPVRLSAGQRVADWLETRAGGGAGGAFLLGAAFAFSFCPTLFLLFFGLTLPLALTSPLGVTFPALFALGTTLPLLGLAGVIGAGAGTMHIYLAGARRLDAWLRPAAGIVLLLAGLNDTLTYWFL
jgi:cytochrome c-type biogenesis protein